MQQLPTPGGASAPYPPLDEPPDFFKDRLPLAWFRFTNRHGKLVQRPAVIVNAFEMPVEYSGTANLLVFYDGENDLKNETGPTGLMWVTSVHFSPTPANRTWTWMLDGAHAPRDLAGMVMHLLAPQLADPTLIASIASIHAATPTTTIPAHEPLVTARVEAGSPGPRIYNYAPAPVG